MQRAAAQFQKLQNMVREEISKKAEEKIRFGSGFDMRNLPQISATVKDGSLLNLHSPKAAKQAAEVGMMGSGKFSKQQHYHQSNSNFHKGGGFKDVPSPKHLKSKAENLLNEMSLTKERFQAMSPTMLYK